MRRILYLQWQRWEWNRNELNVRCLCDSRKTRRLVQESHWFASTRHQHARCLGVKLVREKGVKDWINNDIEGDCNVVDRVQPSACFFVDAEQPRRNGPHVIRRPTKPVGGNDKCNCDENTFTLLRSVSDNSGNGTIKEHDQAEWDYEATH